MIHCSDGQLTCPPPETMGMSHISGTFTGAGVWLLLSNWLVPGGLIIMGSVLLAGGNGVLSGLSVEKEKVTSVVWPFSVVQ